MTRVPQGPREAARMPIDEARFVTIHGMEQWVTIRGRGRSNPALLILGGAGAALSSLGGFFAPWEERFTLVHWDQPFAGRTFERNGPEPLSFARLARDGAAVAEYALDLLGAETLAVLGISLGSATGLRLARDRPDLVHAYVGCGQVVHWARQEAEAYEILVARARLEGETDTAAELAQIGPPPWHDLESVALKGRLANRPTAMEAPELAAAFASAEAPAGHDVRTVAMAAFAAIWKELQDFDAWAVARRFETPMLFVQGALDAHTPTMEVQAYAAAIEAPSKAVVVIEGAGHMTGFLRRELLALLDLHARP